MKLSAVFSKRGPPKIRGGPRQLPHLLHPISTTGPISNLKKTRNQQTFKSTGDLKSFVCALT